MQDQFSLVLKSIDYDPDFEGTGCGLLTITLNASGLASGATFLEWSEWVTDGELERIDSQDSCGHNDLGCWHQLAEYERDAVQVLLEELAEKYLKGDLT